jgi:molybdate transport system substrate-binding protein
MKKYLNYLVIAVFIILFAGCGKKATTNEGTATVTPTAGGITATSAPTVATDNTATVTLNISAAASLKDSMEEIKKLYVEENKNVNIIYNFGSSGILEQQIEQGADVDIFMAAAEKQMKALADKKLILSDTNTNLLKNDVVLVIPKDSTVAITDFKGLTSDKIKKLAMGEPKTVPAGQYGEEVLTKLGILDKMKDKVVYGKDVKEVLTWVESGDADAGIVYTTDAKISTKVKVVATAPADSHTPVVYPAAVINTSKQPNEAKTFLKYLSGDKAKAVFEKYGFTMYTK